jgi:hypothetical protein
MGEWQEFANIVSKSSGTIEDTFYMDLFEHLFMNA